MSSRHYEIAINAEVMVKLGFWYSCRMKVSICQSFIIQTSLLITHSLDFPTDHHDMVILFFKSHSLVNSQYAELAGKFEVF